MGKREGMNKRSWAALLIIVIGVGVHVYQLIQIQQQISLESTAIENIGFEGELSPYPIPSDVTFDLVLIVNNPTRYGLEIDRITYAADINGERLLSDSLSNIEIAGRTPITIPVKVSLEDAAITLLDSFLSDGVELKISGEIDLPIKLFGVYSIFTVSIPYERTEFIDLPGIDDLESYLLGII